MSASLSLSLSTFVPLLVFISSFQSPYCILLSFVSFPSREHPVFFMFVQIAIISIFKSYPTVGDIALYMAFLPVWSHLYRCKFFVFDCSLSGMGKGLSNNCHH